MVGGEAALAEATQPEALVEAALEQLMSWPGLARSPQLARFLNYIVKAKLRGDEASIKAYAIAVDVFGRPQSFDPQSDPIVRVQARRLRAALDEYYAGDGAGSPVRISLPVGRYVPEFEFRDDLRPSAPVPEPESLPPEEHALATQISVRPGRPRSDMLLYPLLLVIGLGIVVVLMQVLSPRPPRIDVPRPPAIGVAEFTAIAGAGSNGAPAVAGLAVELVTDLRLFEDIDAHYVPTGTPDDGAAPEYQLTGIARQEVDAVQITASLRRRGSDTALWSDTEAVPLDRLAASVDDLSQAFAEQLGSHRGPLFEAANRWLDDNPNISGNETVYLCGLLFSRYRDSAELADAARARDCLTGLLDRNENAQALAMRGGLLLDDTMATQPLRPDPEPMAEAGRLLGRAVDLDPTSSLVWQEYARYLERLGRSGEAEAAYASALQLNPANLDAEAAYARMLSLRGESPRGAALALDVLTHAVQPPHWYYAAPAVNALRAGNDAGAIENAEKLEAGDAELASAVATVAAFRSDAEDVLNRYFAQLLDVTRFRRFGILPVLRQRISDTALVDQIAAQLKAAGVADEALNGSF
jgi:tetratricopeptide (TPR) repeat protein